jgi:hypothetical protein
MDPRCAIVKQVVADHDASFIRPNESCDGVQCERLSRTTLSKQNGDRAFRFDVNVQGECGGLLTRGERLF